jgi:uncharacterized membrane protein HdeD (DUF308 family)
MSTPHSLPSNERREELRREDERSLKQVQHWVITLLIFMFAAFPIGGLIGASQAMLDQKRSSSIGLMIMAGVIGLAAVAIMRFVHQKSALTPLLLLGIVPALIASYFVF